jgi:hypothetical protein
VHAGLHPVELGEDVVRKVQAAVRKDVALDATQHAEGLQQLVRGSDLVALAADLVRGQPANRADGGSVVADRQVLVAALAGRAAHLLYARAPVRPGGVAVQVAADRVHLHQGRRLAAERLLTQLRRAPRDTERAVDRLLVGRVRQRLERRDVLCRPGGAHERRAEPLRLGGHELDGHALDGDADRPPLGLVDHRDNLGQRREAREHVFGVGRRADHRQLLARVAPATHIAGPLAAKRGRYAAHQLPGARQEKAPLRSWLASAGERLEKPRLRLWADAGSACEPAGRRRLAKLLGGSYVERPRQLDRAFRTEP